MGTLTLSAGLLLVFAILLAQQCAESAPKSDHGGKSDEHHGHGHRDHGHHGRHDEDDDDDDSDDDHHHDHSRKKHKHERRRHDDDDDDDDDDSSHGHHEGKDHDDDDHRKKSHKHHDDSHEHHKHKSHEDHEHDGDDNWDELGNYQRRILEIILRFIQTQQEGFTGIIHFDGVDYPVDYILTDLSFNRLDLFQTHVHTFWRILKQYDRRSRSRNGDDLLLDLIRKYIRRPTAGSGTISFKGYKISVQYIIERLRGDGLDVRDATRQNILVNIYDYINRNYPNTITVQVPAKPTEEDKRILEIILEFLRIEGRQDEVTFSFRRLPVPANAIFQYVDSEGRAIESVTPGQLYHYIIKYFQDLKSASTGTNRKVPDSVRQQLQQVLSFLQIQSGSGEAPTGYIVYNNNKIATSLILTIIHTLGKSVYQININELYDIILTASEYVENNPDEDPAYITLIYILDLLRNGSPQSDGYVLYEGYTISLRDIKNALSNRGVSPDNATPQIIFEIVTSLIEKASKPVPQPLGKEPTQEQQRQLSVIISFLQTQGDQYSGDIPFAGHVIPVDFILKQLKQNNLNLNQDNLYIIILKYVESTESTEAPQEEISTLKSILKFLKSQSSSGEIPNSVIRYENIDIPVGLIYTIINTSGKTTQDADIDDLYRALQLAIRYVNDNPEEDPTYVTLIYILDSLKNGDAAPNGYAVFNKHIIPLKSIEDALQQKGISPKNATPDIILSILNSQISDQTTPAPEQLGQQPSEDQKKQLLAIISLLQSQRLDYSADIIFSGLSIPISYIIQQLTKQNVDLNNLDENTVYYIIKKYVDTTSAEEPPEEMIPQLQNLLNLLQLQDVTGDIPTGSITYNNIQIPLSLIYTIIEISGKSVKEVDIDYLHKAILTAFKYVYQNRDSNPTTVNLIYIADTLKNGKGNPNGYIVYNGRILTVQKIKEELKLQGLEPKQVTTEILFNIIISKIQRQTTARPEPLLDEPTGPQTQELQVLVNFLQSQGQNYTGDLPFSGYNIPITFILIALQQKNIKVSDIDDKTLYLIIVQYVDSIQTTTSTTAQSIPDDETQQIQTITNFLILESRSPQSPTGYITYENTKIPTSIVLTILDATNIPVDQADVNNVYHALQAAKSYVNNNPDKNPTDITAIYILDLLRNMDQPEGFVVYNGKNIALQTIKDALNEQGVTPEDATPEIILNILNSRVNSEPTTTTTLVALGSEPTEQQEKELSYIVQFIQSQGNDYSGTIPFSGYDVPITFILNALQQKNIKVSYIDDKTLYLIIVQYVDSIQTTTSTTAQSISDDETQQIQTITNFLILESRSPQSPTGYITYENTKIPTSIVLTILDATNIPVDQADVNNVYHALQAAKSYVNNNPDKNPTDITAIYILDLLRNMDQPEGFVVYNGKNIALQTIKDALNEQGVTPEDATPEIILNILNSRVNSEPTTTTTPVALGSEPTEQQEKELSYIVQFIQSPGNDYSGTIPFSGYDVPISFILNALQQKNIKVSDIDDKTLYLIIVQYVDSIQTTTSTTAQSIPDDETQQIQTITNFLILESGSPQSPTGYITYENTKIPTSIVLTILDATNIPVDQADVNNVYHALQAAKSYVNNNPDKNPTDITAIYILDLLRNMDQPEGFVVYNGKNIALQTIKDALNEQGVTPEDAKPEIMLNILNSRVNSEPTTTTTPVALGSEPTEQQEKELGYIVQFIQSQGNDYSGTIPFSGYDVPITFILNALQQKNIKVSDIDDKTLYLIIVQYVDSIQTTTSTTAQSIPDDETQQIQTITNFLILESRSPQSPTGYITYENTKIPTSIVLTILDATNIPVDQADVNNVYHALQAAKSYVNNNPDKNPTDITAIYILDLLRNMDQPEGFVVYNGKNIALQTIKDALNEQGVTPEDATPEIILNILNSRVNSEPTTTTTPVALGSEPTEQQEKELSYIVQFIQSQGNDYSGTIPFSGYDVPISFILNALQQKNIKVSDIDDKTLYLIIVQYVDSIQTTTSTTAQSIPDDETQQIQTITNFLILESRSPQSPTGYITYENTKIPISIVFTILDATNIPVDQADVNNVYHALQAAKSYVNNNPDKNPTDITAIYILDLLRNMDQPEGFVVYNGKNIALQTIKDTLNEQGVTPEDAKPEIILNILNSRVNSEPTTTTTPVALGSEPTEQQEKELGYIVQFIQSQGNDYSGTIPFSGYDVPITFILNALQQKNIKVSDIDDKTLYLIIVQYVDSIQTTTSTTAQSIPDDETQQIQTITNFLILESRSPQSPTGYITYENTKIPTSIVLTILDATNIPVDQADVNNVYHALQAAKSYVNNNPDKNPTDITAIYILDLLRNMDQPEGYVVYNGKNIALQTIKDALNEQAVTPEDATPEIILNILNSRVNSLPTTTTTPVALGSQPTEQQEKELSYIVQLLKDDGIDYKGTIPFEGYLIQMEDIKKQLQEQSKSISDLDTNTLYNIILTIVRDNEPTTPTTELSTGPILTPDEESTLQNTVQLLQAEGENATGNVTVHGEVIPISYLVTVIRLNQIDFQDVTAQQLYQFILEYIEKEQNPPPVNETSGIPADDVLTVQLILDQLKQNSNAVTIVFDGKEISKDFILKILKITGKDVQQLTLSELYKIFVVYLQSEGQTKTEQLPQGYASVLQQVLNALKSQGSRLQGSITINSQSVSLQQLWQIIALQKIDVQKLSIEELYRILVILLDEQGTKVDPQMALYDNVIKALQSGDSSTYSFTVSGKVISLSYIITSLGLQKDSSGHYDTSKITVSGLWQVIREYLTSNQMTTTKKASVQEQTFTTFKEGVAKYNEGYTVTINYNGKNIPIEYVFEQLNLQKDSNGHYNGDSVTKDQLIKVLDSYSS